MNGSVSQRLAPETARRFERLLEGLRRCGSVLVAFSGGVDSSVLLKAATMALGAGKAAGASVTGDIFPSWEIEMARRLAREQGFDLRVIEASPLSLTEFANNPADRCYHCKRFLFTRLLEYAREQGFTRVLEGTNADDVGDHRPGMRATAELGVLTPLKDAGLTKAQIRELARAHGLFNWDEPSAACLASRVPYGQPITPEKLAAIDAAERYLRESCGVRQARVRHEGRTARIEVAPDDIARLAQREVRETLVARLRQLGFAYVSLDLQGYRTGSLNEILR